MALKYILRKTIRTPKLDGIIWQTPMKVYGNISLSVFLDLSNIIEHYLKNYTVANLSKGGYS